MVAQIVGGILFAGILPCLVNARIDPLGKIGIGPPNHLGELGGVPDADKLGGVALMTEFNSPKAVIVAAGLDFVVSTIRQAKFIQDSSAVGHFIVPIDC